MNCIKCGNELKDGAKFCNKCGNAVAHQQSQNQAQEKICKNCGIIMSAGLKFCKKCGAKYEISVTVPQPPYAEQNAISPIQSATYQQSQQQPSKTQYNQSAAQPGDRFSILSLVLGLFLGPVGIVFWHLSNKKQTKANLPHLGMAKAGLIVSIVETLLFIIGIIISVNYI